MRYFLLGFVVTVCLTRNILADDVIGAANAIQKAQELAQQKPAARGEKGEKSDIVSFVTIGTKMNELKLSLKTIKPEEHVTAWLELAEMLGKIANSETSYQVRERFSELTEIMPPPSTWSNIVEKIRAREIPKEPAKASYAYALRMFAAVLAKDDDAKKKEREAWSKIAVSSRSRFGSYSSPIREAEEDFTYRDFNVDFSALEPKERYAKLDKVASSKQTNYSTTISVPDLITEIEPEKSAALIDKLLMNRQLTQITFTHQETLKLAKERALALGKKLPIPRWELVTTAEDMPLYDAFEEMIKEKKKSSGNFLSGIFGGRSSRAESQPLPTVPAEAENIRIGVLLDDDYGDEVKKILVRRVAETKDAEKTQERHMISHHGRTDNSKAFNAEQKAKLLKLYAEAFEKKLEDFPWSDYFSVAAGAENLDDVKKLADQGLADEKMPAEVRTGLTEAYFSLLLSKDLKDEAIAVLRKNISVIPKEVSNDQNRYSVDQFLQHAINLHTMGDLLGNKELEEEGLATAKKRFATLITSTDADRLEYSTELMLKTLLRKKLYAETEKVAIDVIALATRASSVADENRNNSYSSLSQKALIALCATYSEMGRHSDVLQLLDKGPWWGEVKLQELLEREFDNQSFGVIVARAMAENKKTDLALKVLDYVISKKPGCDPAYELMIQLDPDGAMKKLETLASRDAYQERPLIWKAKMLYDKGENDEAEKVIKIAIAIDPSDGEQGKNTRMFGYKVLADVLRKKGDKETAKVFDGAIAAIRKSERADDFSAAGLKAMARKMYQDSLDLFNDAYCIQSRLAIQLFSEGDLDGATIHFQRAFQLMPSSFGMIESHCFGCEGAFSGELAQQLAEKVFTELLKNDPEKPQLHYLLGYLRSAQGRKTDAIKHYQDAVKLAPSYLNAWSKMADLADDNPKYAAIFDDASLEILKLDPYQKHSHIRFSEIHDLARLWTALEIAAKDKFVPPTVSYELAGAVAEKARLDKVSESANGERMSRSYTHYSYSSFNDNVLDKYPGKVISENRQFSEIKEMLSN